MLCCPHFFPTCQLSLDCRMNTQTATEDVLIGSARLSFNNGVHDSVGGLTAVNVHRRAVKASSLSMKWGGTGPTHEARTLAPLRSQAKGMEPFTVTEDLIGRAIYPLESARKTRRESNDSSKRTERKCPTFRSVSGGGRLESWTTGNGHRNRKNALQGWVSTVCCCRCCRCCRCHPAGTLNGTHPTVRPIPSALA